MTRTSILRRLTVLVSAAVIAMTVGATPAAATPAPPAPVACTGCWHPALQTSWNWVLSVVPTAPYRAVAMYDVDGFDNTAANVAALHAAGIKAVCYLSAGTYENWRPDAGQFPASILGRNNGWPGEKWLDIRQISVLGPIMSARVQKCKQAGFDGVEFDNVDGYSNKTGFPLTANDQLAYNTYLANLAHSNGLSVALKNDLGQAAALKPYFDYAINEQCMQYKECDYPAPGLPDWTASGKAVFEVEYRSSALNCTKSNGWNFNAILKTVDLFDTPWTPCR